MVGLPFHEPAGVAAAADASSEEAHGHAVGVSAEAHLLSDEGHHEPGLVIGTGEPIDPYGAMTQLAQVSAAALALTLLVRSTPGGRYQ